MSETTRRQCFFVPGKPGIIDELNLATGRSYIEKENLEEIRLRHPGAEIGDLDDCAQRSEEMFRTDPREITQEKYDEMLNVLPPQRWVQDGGTSWRQHGYQTFCLRTADDYTSSFEMSEHMYGRVTSFFVAIGQRFFTYDGYAGTPHQDKVRRCAEAFGIKL